jgi:hypothetical protein
MNDPEFWKMIEERRRRPSAPLEEVRARLLGKPAAARKPARVKVKSKGK